MKKHTIAMLGAGSGFVISVAKELAISEVLQDTEFVLMDPAPARLARAKADVDEILKAAGSGVQTRVTGKLAPALDGADHVVTGCEINRMPNWIKDIEIPQRYGVYQVMGENGGPGGIIHAMRNISMFMPILAEMERRCPRAWLHNFTNPMSFLCTYFKNYSPIRALGYCHGVHGSFGVIAEMLGMAPGELEVITGGVNHFNWLFDVRKRGTGESCMEEFLKKVRASTYWKKNRKNIPEQKFTLEVLETFGAYPVGYDGHIVEYLPFFYEKHEWAKQGFESITAGLRRAVAQGERGKMLEAMTLHGGTTYPFPKDNNHPYYAEKPCAVIEALETNRPTYLDAINIVNHGSISNLPADAIVDIPALAVGGKVRGIHVGELPIGPMELCRRQITLHEMIARATQTGDEKLVVQALCLSPYVRSITQARAIWRDYRKEFSDCLPTFR